MNGQPLASRLKRSLHRSVALAQDIVMEEVYQAFPECVLHGGTAIWRCYGGGRFSEDVDVYIPLPEAEAMRKFRDALKSKGLEELKFKATENTVFAKYDLSASAISFEAALRQPPKSVVRPYQMVDGTLMLVRTLTPEGLVSEKASAYLSRRKVRDLYDIYFLLNLVKDSREVLESLAEMVREYRKPVDENQLRAIVIVGTAPSSETMIEGIRRWVSQST